MVSCIRGRSSACVRSHVDIDAFLAQLQKQTASLESADLPQLLSHLTAETPRPTPQVVHSIASAYAILLLTPPEYLPRALHNEFLKRGFAADVVILLTLRHAKDVPVTTQHLLTVREVLRRTIAHMGVVERLVRAICFILLSDCHSYS